MSRTFECLDGTLIEVLSDQAILWESDTCLCHIVFEQDTLDYDFSMQNCKVHTNLPDNQIVNQILQMNNLINNKYGDTMNEEQIAEIAKDRETGLANNKALGSATIKADKDTKATIEAYLRSQGR